METFVAFTVALAIGAPDGSVTVPSTVAVVTWACAAVVVAMKQSRQSNPTANRKIHD